MLRLCSGRHRYLDQVVALRYLYWSLAPLQRNAKDLSIAIEFRQKAYLWLYRAAK